MDKIVGKFLFILVLLVNSSLYSDVSLKILDLKGNTASVVQAGKPFKIEVRWTQSDRTMRTPQIRGIEQFRALGKETSMHFLHGVTTIAYNYRVCAEQPGTFILGPAHIPSLSNEKSPTVKIIVKKAATNHQPETAAQTIFARLTLDKNNTVVDERIHCTLKFYFNDPHVSLLKILPPDLSDVEIKNQQRPKTGSEYINGTQYMYVSIEWDMYAKQPGKITIPGYGLDCNIPVEHDEESLMPFFRFFNRHFEHKRLYSNSVDVVIDPLPTYTGSGTVLGLGNFKYFSAHVNPQHAKVGEGIVLRLDLEGEGECDVDAIPFFELVGLSNAVKWYDSSSSLQRSNQKEGFFKKSFEYILQGLKAGEYKIPEQQFTFFDPKIRTYKTLRTEPVLIQIEPSLKKENSDGLIKTTAIDDQPSLVNSNDNDKRDNVLAPIEHEGPCYTYHERSLASWLFLLLCVIPVVMRKKKDISLLWHRKIVGKSIIYKQARKALMLAEKKREFESLYPIFMNCIAAQSVDKKLSHEIAIDQIVLSGLTEKQTRELHLFLNKIAEFVFFKKNQQITDDSLFKQALAWLEIFEKNNHEN